MTSNPGEIRHGFMRFGWPPGTAPTCAVALSGTVVCDRHRSQYDERPDLGPYRWESLR